MDRASPLNGLTVLVTGAGRGIGRACALSSAQAGARVVAVARTRRDLDDLKEEAGPRLETRQADVTEQAFWRELESNSNIDVLVNNAGTNRLQAIDEVDDATLDLLLMLNVRSAFKTSQAVARSMIARRRGGAIIHISSQMGHVGAAKRSVYCMTKHAIEGLTKAMAIELAAHDIRVNAVAPTIVETSMTAPFLQDASYRQFAMDTIPLKRVAEPQDVAEAVVYLASPAARLVTGTSLKVDGGATAQ
ncbi:SDR family NAD(P)-dependent oxidoreductase [Bradyrhizobium sp. CCBAU 11361]|jgi:NAD(P)-dependent dehydrogenase (short-subunit alcohol dehydrogenase family)|uniref:SDR family NAD(P)-dependent oxidoreductase n=1 Tax=Bradyrhizobium sp. CCBAU 11361 TaxID=1630812 RepID=UPI002305C799|nr:SDR family oxidoreductase [Bradyrhizobium sp. CCBAU 11361]MDA9492763.1 3-oxoacyl-ACP reductase [Bradyrhizobium sp. CCBAU 11361]